MDADRVPADLSIVAIADRPDLVPIVAHWLWTEFWADDGYKLDRVEGVIAASTATCGPQQTFVALLGAEPVGTASLVKDDLDERPNLTPWLAGVYVMPGRRGLGIASRLVARVEQACADAGIGSAWLYTSTAAGLYGRLGWQWSEHVDREGKPTAAVMRKRFGL